MKTPPQALLDQAKALPLATKLVIGAALVGVLGVAGFTSMSAGRPHFQMLYSGLDAQHAASVQAALAGGAIRYEVSQPPGPFVIHVDEKQYYQAQNLVALSGALESAPQGIQTNGSGASQVFLSAPERAQNVLKREWQELEKQLEELDFVDRAHVSTSTPDPSPLRRATPMTIAVTLALRGGTALDQGQAATVAKLVRYRFNVPSENVVISDQSGRSLYDGSATSDGGSLASELLDHKTRYDAQVAQSTNQVLDRILGPGMAYVVVQSQWRCEESESVKETIDPKPVVVSKTESKTSTPGASTSAGGAVGTAANLASEFGVEHAALGGPAVAAAAGKSTTQETTTASVVGRETAHRRSSGPEIERMSVSLFVDASLQDRLGSLEASVKTAVGYVDARDAFSSMATPFASIARDGEGKLVAPEPVVAEPAPSRLAEVLIERGVEIVCALAFLVVLVKSIRTASRSAAKPKGAGAAGAAGDGIDPRAVELLAKREVEELVKNEPERIGSILSRWAAEEDALVEAGR